MTDTSRVMERLRCGNPVPDVSQRGSRSRGSVTRAGFGQRDGLIASIVRLVRWGGRRDAKI
jgi:hypothetical protein